MAFETHWQHGKERTHHARRAAAMLCAAAAAIAVCAPAAHAQWEHAGLDSLEVSQLYVHNDTIVVGIFFSSNGGTTWVKRRLVYNRDTVVEMNPVAFAADPANLSIWYTSIVGYDSIHQIYRDMAVFKTTNAGETWTEQRISVYPPAPIITNLVVSWANPNVLFGYDSHNSWLARSDDGGKTWRDIGEFGGSLPATSLIFTQDQTDSNVLYVVGGEGYEIIPFMSTNGGNSWMIRGYGEFGQMIAGYPTKSDIYMLFAGGGIGPVPPGNEQTVLAHSSDFGWTWDTSTQHEIEQLSGVDTIWGYLITPDGHQFASINWYRRTSNVIVKYTDSSNWEYLPPIIDNGDTLYGSNLWWDDVTQTLYVNGGKDTLINFLPWLSNRGIWKYQLSTGVWELAQAIPASFVLGQNYPNPANAATTIPVTMKTGGNVVLILYDMAGNVVKRVAAGSLPSGNHVFTVNMQDLPAGAYVYSLKNGTQRSAKILSVIH